LELGGADLAPGYRGDDKATELLREGVRPGAADGVCYRNI